MSNITHKNHYVPQFYLRNWSSDGNKIWVYSLLVPDSKVPYWKEKSIETTAVWNDLYTRYNGIKEVDDFEKWFNKEFETPAEPVIKKLINGEKITRQEEIKVTHFVAAQSIRVPAKVGHILDISYKCASNVLSSNIFSELNKQKIDEYRLDCSNFEDENFNELLPIRVKIDRENSCAEVNTTIGRGYYLYALKYLLTETLSKIESHRWQVIHSAENISFPTTDNPVICLNYRGINDYDFDGGWGRINGNIIMPISPKCLLYTQIGSDAKFEEGDYSPFWSEFFRKIIIEHAYRFVYAVERQRGMLAINPRYVNLKLYLEEKNKMADWNDEQIKAEQDVLNG